MSINKTSMELYLEIAKRVANLIDRLDAKGDMLLQARKRIKDLEAVINKTVELYETETECRGEYSIGPWKLMSNSIECGDWINEARRVLQKKEY